MSADCFNFTDGSECFTTKRRTATDHVGVRSDVHLVIRDKDGSIKHESFQHNLRTNVGADFWNQQLFAGTLTLTGTNTITSVAAATGTAGPNGTATSVYTGTFTNGGSNAYAGYLVVLTGGTTAVNNGTYLCIASTATTITLANPNGALQSTGTLPTVWTTAYPGNGGFTAKYMGITIDATAAAATDTTLTTEETTNGLARALGVITHTASATSSQIANTWTYTGASSKALAKVGLFTQATNGQMILETVLSSTGTVSANGDTISVTWTINY